MSPTSEDNGRSSTARESESLLSSLPSTRPQRSSARRLAAREAASGNGAVAEQPASPRSGPREKTSAAARGPKVGASRQRSRPAAAPRGRAAAAAADTAPMQGYECEGDRANGPVQPPGSSDLAASAAEILGELAKAGLSSGERLLKDVLGRLPLS